VRRFLVPKIVGAAVLLSTLGGGAAYAFTANNVVNTSLAGEGVGNINGYTAYNIHYHLAQATPVAYDQNTVIDGVAFNLNNAATQVGVSLWSYGGANVGGGQCFPLGWNQNGSTLNGWAGGVLSGSNEWVCNLATQDNPGSWVPVNSAYHLDISAAN
jgi:hypothetical protein